MTGPFIERRQSPRIALDGAVQCRLDLRTRVRMLDISLTGALLASELPLPSGAAAEFRSGLGSQAFRTEVQVQRAVALTAGALTNGIGAMFTTMDDRSRRSLEEFLRKASQ